MMSVYDRLNTIEVNTMKRQHAEELLLSILAERATITGKGTILRFSEFNENPDPLVGELLARILVSKMDPTWFDNLTWDEIAVVSIENSAAYLAGALAYEIAKVYKLDRPPRIVRARKLPKGEHPSPALGEKKVVVAVKPITAAGDERYLVASVPNDQDLVGVKVAVVADDFRATGSTLDGGIRLCQELLHPKMVIPVAALGKPSQETIESKATLTAIDVSFWADAQSGNALIKVNDYQAVVMERVTANDFSR